jgi:class 3 adenylate cyclase
VEPPLLSVEDTGFDSDGEPSSASGWLEAVRREERRGEFLAEYDLASRGLELFPDDLWLKHRAVLALARAGSTNEAGRRFTEFGLHDVDNEEIAALGARIEKDVALSDTGETQRRRAEQAADAYAAIYSRTGGYYPAVNAATLALLAGDAQRSKRLATEVLSVLENEDERSYYAAATEAEASLLLGNEGRARKALAVAAMADGSDYAAHFSTRRQLRIICRLRGVDEDLLDILAGPEVVHFCGHLIDPRQDGAGLSVHQVPDIARKITAELARRPVGVAYGALASGADLLWAEALLASGCELHVVLPFSQEEFIRSSVAPAGDEWVERFHRCMTAATAVHYATNDACRADDVLFRYGAELAMGLTLLRARYLDATARQLVVWDGRPARGDAGTAIEVSTWQRAGGAVTIVDPSEAQVHILGPNSQPDSSGPAWHPRTAPGSRVLRAMLFADIRGFSKLSDDDLASFASQVLGTIARVLDRHKSSIEYRNTWGDAIYVVLTGIGEAAACALELQEALGDIDLASVGLPSHLALRLAAHFGPVLAMWDPVLDEMTFVGSQVNRTARIEPVTPPGAVYVTEHFAAALVLERTGRFVCDYVGHMPAAKDFGRLRMYRLRRSSGLNFPRAGGGGLEPPTS